MNPRPYLREVSLKGDTIPDFTQYPFVIPSIRCLETLTFHQDVTFFIGENGMGKSTLLEAIAVALRLNPEGGSKNFGFSTRESHTELYRHLRIVRSFRRPRDSFFLRAESFFNVATEIERLDADGGLTAAYGGISLHEQSHGESFLSLMSHRFRGNGLYLLDEPEAALSVKSQLLALRCMHDLVGKDSQFIIATHSPILLAYPGAKIVHFGERGLQECRYEDTESFQVTRAFFNEPQEFVARLLSGDQEFLPGFDSVR